MMKTPAEIYDELFVPALFGQWGGVVSHLAGVRLGDRVLDVACGTGVLSCAAAHKVGPAGAVVGLDASEEMLAVARRKSAKVEWRVGRAESLPFPDASFDAVVSQFGMMFFEDRAAALREMLRVLKPGRRLAVAVCGDLAESPGYWTLAKLLDRLFGTSVGDAFRAPFALGNAARLREICADAGIDGAEVVRREGTVRFPSIPALVSTERACVWTLGGLLDDAQFERLRSEAEHELAPFAAMQDGVAFPMPGLIVTAAKF